MGSSSAKKLSVEQVQSLSLSDIPEDLLELHREYQTIEVREHERRTQVSEHFEEYFVTLLEGHELLSEIEESQPEIRISKELCETLSDEVSRMISSVVVKRIYKGISEALSRALENDTRFSELFSSQYEEYVAGVRKKAAKKLSKQESDIQPIFLPNKLEYLERLLDELLSANA